MSRKIGIKCVYFNFGKLAKSDEGLKLYRFVKDHKLCRQQVYNTGKLVNV